MGAAADVPEDVWRLIASFLPESHRRTLISVNKAFYNIVLDERYGVVRWDKLDRAMIKSLARLRTPLIARRVRRLHILAWFIEYLSRKEALHPPSAFVTFKRWLGRRIRLPSAPLPIAQSSHGKSSAANDILTSMTEAVRLMTGVTEYSFEWRDLPASPPTQRFLVAARAAFGVSLRKLTLHAQLDNFASLLSTVDFDNLEELDLFFDHDTAMAKSAVFLRDSIAPFINHFRRSLSTLTLASASKADLSPLFHALEPIPQLHKFVVSLQFDSAHLSDPSGISKVLSANADSLYRVEIARSLTTSTSTPAAPDDPPSTWPLFSTALLTSQPALSNLQTLRLPALSSGFDATLACLRRAADTLTTLSLREQFLHEPELLELLEAFVHRPLDSRLVGLHVGLHVLSLDVLDLLAVRMPGMQRLYLVLTHDAVRSTAHTSSSAFCMDLYTRFYSAWQLHDIGIWEERFSLGGVATHEETELTEHIAQRIPTIRKCRGQPAPAIHTYVACANWMMVERARLEDIGEEAE
ncbi:hypothetical protein HMN09_00798800 [Mycena chlorophos]|uniref:F-box domain-containing protein n=1 Tax=Mycena chlorophos TaxID=658473 RepID=A0A8H6W772_MYCCL|nr:hypothetical protein HMN09_00798800 [Mycena chlorophos]